MQTNPIRQTQNRRTQNAEQIAAVPGIEEGMSQKVQDLLLKLSSNDAQAAREEAAKPAEAASGAKAKAEKKAEKVEKKDEAKK